MWGSTSSMICIARTFGAPDSVPAGSTALSASIAVTSGRSVPETWLTMWCTCEYASTIMNSSTTTEPNSETRPRSFRPRSTSITCSARSFGSRSRSSARRRSSSSLSPRG